MREPLHNDVHPVPVQPMRAATTRKLRLAYRMGAAGLVLGCLALGWVMFGYDPGHPAMASAAAVVKATDTSIGTGQISEQAKAEIALLKDALAAAQEVNGHHRHHSETMWQLLSGKINVTEAWWQGGDSTCLGWEAANRFEEAVGKLKGEQVQAKPLTDEAKAFCKAARERK